ncbi:MAG: hypothetical protein KBH45_19340 [Verrucomicrobia bacterium]|nr:hypothetical protein [Verrucomicrobiota bacterium]
MVLVLGMVALGLWAWRWSQKTILLVQAAVSVAQAVVIVLFVMRERKWQQQENLQKPPTPESKGSVSTDSAAVSQQTESEIGHPPSQSSAPQIFYAHPLSGLNLLAPSYHDASESRSGLNLLWGDPNCQQS